MGKRKESGPRTRPQITQEEENYQIIFDFAYWLENGLGKAGCGGATELLRRFLQERKEKEL